MQEQQYFSPSSSHASKESWLFQHPTDYNENTCYFSFSPTAHNNDNLRQQQMEQEEAINYCYDVFGDAAFVLPTPKEKEEEEKIVLPSGWELAGRKRSIFELETNIRTLGDLYSTLMDLRSQLPSLQRDQEEEPNNLQTPSLSTRRSSSFSTSNIYSTLSRFESSNYSLSAPCEEEDIYFSLTSTYPDFIFESLLQIYASNCSSSSVIYLHKKKDLVESYHLGKLNKPYASAIFAYTALHALLCHSKEFGIHSFLKDLACDAYRTAHELVEFDFVSTMTIDTLMIMYQYLCLMDREGEARNLFCVAWRQMELLLEESGKKGGALQRLPCID